MNENADLLRPNDRFPADTPLPQRQDILQELSKFGVESGGAIKLMDSTRDASDIRLNYIVDKKWVLRFCNAPDMTETRMGDLSRLVERYRAMGYRCPAFVPDSGGKYLHPWNALVCYLSEYVDLPLAREREGDMSGSLWETLAPQINEHVARFAQRYRNVDLSDTMGMYSLFDLNPYDLADGVDEKQSNFDELVGVLRSKGETVLAQRLEVRHTEIRRKLRAVYRDLPRCVFQGDENASNVLVDENGNFAGLIDFNLAGTEVIVNQLANLAGFDYGEERTDIKGAQARLELALRSYRKNMAHMLQFYHTDEQERQALIWYAWVVMVSQWPTASFFEWAIQEGGLKEEICELLSLIADLPEECLQIRETEE